MTRGASAGRTRGQGSTGRLVLAAALGLAGCGALQDQVTKQGAELAELRTGVDGLRADLQALRQQIAGLQTALEAADRRATTERETSDARDREAQEALAQRLATVEHRVDEMADGVTALEAGAAGLA